RSRDAIVIHEMFNGGVEMLSLYMRCSTDESKWYRCTRDVQRRIRDAIVLHEMFIRGVEMVSLYIRCSTEELKWSRDGIVVHEMFNGGVEMLSLYMRCSTEESKWSQDGIVVHEMFNGGVKMKEERVHVLVASLGVSTIPISSARPSTPPSDSPGHSRNAKCSNCKLLLGKIKVLEATIEMYIHPKQHALNSTALLHQVYNEMGKFSLE
ncbi:hypothetical protein Tco_1445767, partial [Tanacetum coccineum]